MRILKQIIRIIVLLIFGVFFVQYSFSSAIAAPSCLKARLYIGANCELCTQIQQDASASMSVLSAAGLLEVINIDKGGQFIGDGLPDFQVFDARTNRLLELFQINPLQNQPKDLVVRDVSDIPSRLQELAQQSECNNVSEIAPSIINKLSVRGISTPVIDAISNVIDHIFLIIWSFVEAFVSLF